MGGRGWGSGILKSVRAVVGVAFGEGSVGLGLRSRMGLSTVGRVVQACIICIRSIVHVCVIIWLVHHVNLLEHRLVPVLRSVNCRSDGCGDARLVHRPDPGVVGGFDDGHPLLFLRGPVQWDGAAHRAVQRLRVLGIRLRGIE